MMLSAPMILCKSIPIISYQLGGRLNKCVAIYRQEKMHWEYMFSFVRQYDLMYSLTLIYIVSVRGNDTYQQYDSFITGCLR